MIIRLSSYKIRFETDADGDYLAHVTFFARASPVQKTSHELKILLHFSHEHRPVQKTSHKLKILLRSEILTFIHVHLTEFKYIFINS